MIGRERIQRILNNELFDRVPVMAEIIAVGAEWLGINQSKLHKSVDVLVSTELGLSEELGLDGAYISSDNWIIHSALGGLVRYIEDDEPQGCDLVLDEWDKLDDLRVPIPEEAERMSFMLSCARLSVKNNFSNLFIEANIDSGPFQLAGILRGVQQLFLDIISEPLKVCKLLEFCTEVVKVYAIAMARTGVDAIQFGDSTASLINKQMYKEFVEPYQVSVLSTIREAGVYPFLHVCGNSNHILELIATSGASCVEIDSPTNLKDAFNAFSGHTIIKGNISTNMFREGSPQEILQYIKDSLMISKGRPFILSPGCSVSRGTPKSNVDILVKAAKENRKEKLHV
jgi:uroporphyrinogen decarboxylase